MLSHKIVGIEVHPATGKVKINYETDNRRKQLWLSADQAERLMDLLNEELPPVIARLRETEFERRKRRIRELRDELFALEYDRPVAEVRYATCPECGDLGYTGSPNNGRHSTMVRCSRGCPVKCSVCNDPNCTNPCGQH